MLIPLQEALLHAKKTVETIVLGKETEIQLCFVALLAKSHILIDDLPGMGKTTLAKTMAHVLGLDFQRVQFTSDLMPADIVGTTLLNGNRQFELHKGPIFTRMLLADEINRASPRTQSALLESMAENQVTIDRQTHALPAPFFVMATQNPVDHRGTFPLPDSQLDRFLFKISMGYPNATSEMTLMKNQENSIAIEKATVCLNSQQIIDLQASVNTVNMNEELYQYAYRLVLVTREHPHINTGLSPRASMALIRAAKANALLSARNYVSPDDIKAVFPPLARHRLILNSSLGASINMEHMIDIILNTTAIDAQ